MPANHKRILKIPGTAAPDPARGLARRTKSLLTRVPGTILVMTFGDRGPRQANFLVEKATVCWKAIQQ